MLNDFNPHESTFVIRTSVQCYAKSFILTGSTVILEIYQDKEIFIWHFVSNLFKNVHGLVMTAFWNQTKTFFVNLQTVFIRTIQRTSKDKRYFYEGSATPCMISQLAPKYRT